MVPPQTHQCSHATWYNFSGLSLHPDDGPHVGPKHVVVGTLIILIIEVNIVVFDCAYSSTWCSKHVEAFNKLIIKQDFVHQLLGFFDWLSLVRCLLTLKWMN